ncbi:MAG: prephenate dehydratase [Acidimicrobiales bacterium]
MASIQQPPRIAYLGPQGTFTEEALRSVRELSSAIHIPFASFREVFNSVHTGQAEFGFIAIENSIEGTVMTTLDALVFEYEFVIVAEHLLDVHQQLLAVAGAELTGLTDVYSFPHASAQVRGFLSKHLPRAVVHATNSTAQAAQLVSELRTPTAAAIGPRIAGELYELIELASNIEDFSNNQTRFVLIAQSSTTELPAPTGHDKTSVVCFQLEDRPGSLLEIINHFASRGINLTKLESRPSKRAIGEYCFIIDFEGHYQDEAVRACMEDIRRGDAVVKWLGSYPAP